MTRALVIALALALALPARAQDPLDSDVPRDVKSAVALDDAQLGEGVWTSKSRTAWMVKAHQDCVDDKKQLQEALEKKPLQPPETDGKIALAATIAGGGGLIVGALIAIVGLIASGHIK